MIKRPLLDERMHPIPCRYTAVLRVHVLAGETALQEEPGQFVDFAGAFLSIAGQSIYVSISAASVSILSLNLCLKKFWLGTIELWMHVLRIDDSDFKDSLYCSLLFWHPLSGLFVRISCTFWCGTNRRYFNQRNNTRCRRRVEVTGNKVSNICK